jgi:tRNA threonylcarbamoyladenosine biosynthesis protein TsaB
MVPYWDQRVKRQGGQLTTSRNGRLSSLVTRHSSLLSYDGNVHDAVNPLILALDTTQEHGSLALERGEELLECREVSAPQAFSRVVFDEIVRLLSAHGASIPDVEVYGVAAGPGSFTGVRVGLAAAKGLAQVHGKRIVPVSNLAAIASLAWMRPETTARVLVPVLDARRKEVYAGVYEQVSPERQAGMPLPPRPRALCQDMVIAPGRLEERLAGMNLPAGPIAFCGPDIEKFELKAFPLVVTPRAIAGAIARLALAAWQAGEAQPPGAVDANYVRRSDAEIFSKPWM